LGFVKKSLSMASNGTYTTEDYAGLLAQASRFNTYLETAKASGMPDADTFHYHIEKLHAEQLHEAFLAAAKRNIAKLRGKKVVAILDITHEPFYGSSTNPYIHGYRPKAGTRGSFAFLACFVFAGEQRIVVDAVPLAVGSDITAEAEAMLGRLADNGISIRVLLIDRGLANKSETLAMLNARRIRYLGLYPKYRNVKKLLGRMKCRGMRCKGFAVKGVSAELAAFKDGKYVWTWVTNMDYSQLCRYRNLYRKRWNIETGFRVQDEARIKTKSLSISVRLFLFLAALLCYNAWKALGEAGIKISFKRFVISGFAAGVEQSAAIGIP
jgi:IS4 transposase